MGPPDPEKTNPPDPESLAAEGLGGRDQSLGHRLARMVPAKDRARQMAGYLLKANEPRLAHRLYQCGAHLHFREWLNHGGRTTLHKGYFCQVPLLCPLCAIRRGAKMLRRYVERATYLLRDHDAYMVTLTVRNGHDLAERFNHLRASLQRLRKRAAKGYGALAVADGYLGSFEFTRGRTGWHPHVHMVWFVPKGAQVLGGRGSQLSLDWKAITGDSFIVDARPLQGDLVGAFCEVLKYALKFSSMSLADNLEAYRSLKGKRLLTSGGCMYGLELPDDARLEDDPLDGPFIEFVYRWAGEQGYVQHYSWVGIEGSLSEDSVSPTLRAQENPSHANVGPQVDSDQGVIDARSVRAPEGGFRGGWSGTGDSGQHGHRAMGSPAGGCGGSRQGGRRGHSGAPRPGDGRADAPACVSEGV